MVRPFWESVWQFSDIKHGVTIWCSNSTRRYELKKNENKFTQKLIHAFHSIIIHSRQNMETNDNQQMNDVWYLYIMECCLFSHEEEWSTDLRHNLGEPWSHHAQWKKPVQKATNCMISFTWSRTAKSRERESRLMVSRDYEDGVMESDC